MHFGLKISGLILEGVAIGLELWLREATFILNQVTRQPARRIVPPLLKRTTVQGMSYACFGLRYSPYF